MDFLTLYDNAPSIRGMEDVEDGLGMVAQSAFVAQVSGPFPSTSTQADCWHAKCDVAGSVFPPRIFPHAVNVKLKRMNRMSKMRKVFCLRDVFIFSPLRIRVFKSLVYPTLFHITLKGCIPMKGHSGA